MRDKNVIRKSQTSIYKGFGWLVSFVVLSLAHASEGTMHQEGILRVTKVWNWRLLVIIVLAPVFGVYSAYIWILGIQTHRKLRKDPKSVPGFPWLLFGAPIFAFTAFALPFILLSFPLKKIEFLPLPKLEAIVFIIIWVGTFTLLLVRKGFKDFSSLFPSKDTD